MFGFFKRKPRKPKCRHEYTIVHEFTERYNYEEYKYYVLYCPLCDDKKKVNFNEKEIVLNSQKARNKYMSPQPLPLFNEFELENEFNKKIQRELGKHK